MPTPSTATVRRAPKLWTPRHVQVTAAAAEEPHTVEILRRLEAAGVQDVRMLRSNRLVGLTAGSEREVYARAKARRSPASTPTSTPYSPRSAPTSVAVR